jgi:hypothetical protein
VGHLDYFQSLALVSRSASVCKWFYFILAHIPSGIYPGVLSLDYIVSLFLVFQELWYLHHCSFGSGLLCPFKVFCASIGTLGLTFLSWWRMLLEFW